MDTNQNYQAFFTALPLEQQEMYNYVDARAAFQLHIQLEVYSKIEKTMSNHSNRIQEIIHAKETLSIPDLPIDWFHNKQLEIRYKKLVEVIVKNKEWWEVSKDNLELLPEGISFKKMGITLPLFDAGLSDWENYDQSKGSISHDNLIKIGQWIEALPETSQKDMREFLGF